MMELADVFKYLRRNREVHITLPLPPGFDVRPEEVKMLAPMVPKLTVKLLLWRPDPPEMVLQFVDAGITSKPIRLRLSAVVFDSTEDLVAFGMEMVRKHPASPKQSSLLITPIDGNPNGNGKR